MAQSLHSLHRPKVLDICCGAGGCSKGYQLAGYDTFGVDIKRQRYYPGPFIQTDGLEYLQKLIHSGDIMKFQLVHVSPPCQLFARTKTLNKKQHLDLIAPFRSLLIESGCHYVIENVVRAPLINPIMLCGAMFPPLKVYRHRLFETSFPVNQPFHPKHIHKIADLGRQPKDGEFVHVVGHFMDVKYARNAMGIDWMSRDELSQAIPPAYCEFIGNEFRRFIWATTSGWM